jgi:hypothetical protein
VSCTSWKSREEPGCGFTANGTLAEFAAKEAELGDAEIVPATPDRAAIVAAGECPQCRKRGLTSHSGKAVRFTALTDGSIACTGYDPVTNAYQKHPVPDGVPDPSDVDPSEIPF